MSRSRGGLQVQRNTIIRIAFGLLGLGYAAIPLLYPITAEINFGVVIVLLLVLIEMLLEVRLETQHRRNDTIAGL